MANKPLTPEEQLEKDRGELKKEKEAFEEKRKKEMTEKNSHLEAKLKEAEGKIKVFEESEKTAKKEKEAEDKAAENDLKPASIFIDYEGEDGQQVITLIAKNVNKVVVPAKYVLLKDGKAYTPDILSEENGMLIFKVSFTEPSLALTITAIDANNNVAIMEKLTLNGPICP
jgi:hypothetical protein